jgi:hypothetical protein
MELTRQQADFFKGELLKAIREEPPLPEEVETDKVYAADYYKYVTRGGIHLRFVVKAADDGGLYLDYYFETDDFISHKRIDASGKVTELETYVGQ